MADTHRLSRKRPHLNLSPYDESDCLQAPITTFTALLRTAQSAHVDCSAVTNKDGAIVTPDCLVTNRQLRNRVSCRKTRLKRKLHQHELEIIARKRHERHEYLTQLALKLGSDSSHQHVNDKLFREFAAKSLHYALVDSEYSGWFGAQVTPSFRSEIECSSKEFDHLPANPSKRMRCGDGIDVLSASQALQSSLFEQWRPIVDGLQNVDLQLYQMEENEIIAGVFDRHCQWKFVGLSVANVKRVGEIAAVAVSGITRLRFQGRHVEEISISTVRREDNVPFNLKISSSDTNIA